MDWAHGTRWQKSEDRTLRAAREAKLTYSIIHERLYWRTREAISMRARRIGITKRASAPPDWTKEQHEALARFIARGMTAGQAARELTRKGIRQVTRNAVLGRLYRQGASA